jgi:transposase-like protein
MACEGSVPNFADRPSSLKLPATVSTDQQAMIESKGSHFERAVILWAVRWYVAYPISYRQLEEVMEEHGVEVDHQLVAGFGRRGSVSVRDRGCRGRDAARRIAQTP